MLEYFTYKKVKKHKAEKAARKEVQQQISASQLAAAPAADNGGADASRAQDDHAVIRPGDETYLEDLISNDDVPAPPLPPRLYSRDLDWQSDNEEAKQPAPVDKAKPSRLSLLFTRSKKPNPPAASPETTTNTSQAEVTTPAEQEREEKDLSNVLDRLNLSVKNNKVISTDSSAALTSFTNVFKDLVNGVPTAYDDLMRIIEDRDGALAKGFDKLPNSMKKLVTQLPDKITSSLGPELLAAAAASQGIKAETSGGLKGTAKNVFMPNNLAQLVTKPGAIVGMLKAIVQVLRTRWPAFIGVNVLWGVALSLLLFVLWYCHKRGREVRLQGERAVDGSDRIEELPDDPMLPAPAPGPSLPDETPKQEVRRQKTSQKERG